MKNQESVLSAALEVNPQSIYLQDMVTEWLLTENHGTDWWRHFSKLIDYIPPCSNQTLHATIFQFWHEGNTARKFIDKRPMFEFKVGAQYS